MFRVALASRFGSTYAAWNSLVLDLLTTPCKKEPYPLRYLSALNKYTKHNIGTQVVGSDLSRLTEWLNREPDYLQGT